MIVKDKYPKKKKEEMNMVVVDSQYLKDKYPDVYFELFSIFKEYVKDINRNVYKKDLMQFMNGESKVLCYVDGDTLNITVGRDIKHAIFQPNWLSISYCKEVNM